MATLGDAELRALSAHATTKSFPKNTVIVNEGDETDSLYVIVSGRVKVYVSDDAGKEIVLATQGAGEYFGEMVLDEGPRSASVMTLEPSQIRDRAEEPVQGLPARHPAVRDPPDRKADPAACARSPKT